MFWGAGIMVKFVMLLLLGFSVYSWFIVFQKFSLYRKAKEESASFLETFWHSKNLAEAHEIAEQAHLCPEATIFKTGYHELQKLGKKQSGSREFEETLEMRMAGMKPLKRALQKAEDQESARFGESLPFLATTGSTAPFMFGVL
jgi:biopolymer transport protein TolQ